MVTFESIHLALAKDEAARRISERVSHIRRTDTESTIEFRTKVGLHLATLSDVTVDGGERGSKLRYRTSYIRPHLFHAHNKATEIQDSVAGWKVSRYRG